MNLNQLAEIALPIVKKHYLPIGLGFLGLLLTGFGLLSGSSKQNNDVTFQQASPKTAVEAAADEKTIMVDVEGGVINPGVYHVKFDARVKDALIAAGGLSDIADRTWAAKNLNLATKITDGAKVYVPTVNDNSGNESGSTATSLVNINTASSSDLDALPGVGLATAAKIISNRPYGVVEELLSKKAVSQKVFDNIKDKISVY